MTAKIFDMDGKIRESDSPKASSSISGVISDVVELNNSGRVKCLLVTMIRDDNSVEHNFATRRESPTSIVGALEAAKYFYLSRCLT